MKNKILFLIPGLIFSLSTFAQQEPMTREEKNAKNAERQARVNSKNDYATFKKQILGLKQYETERQKIPLLRKTSKMAVKVVAIVDSTDNDGESKTLVGYIRQEVGDNTTNMYEITYDRSQKAIISVKHTQEGIDADKELQEDMPEKVHPEKRDPKKIIRPNSKDNDDDDEPEDKPVKGKHKDDDD